MLNPLFPADTRPGAKAPDPQWQQAHPGVALDTAEVAVPADYQRDKLQSCGIDASLFGDAVDPSFFIGIGIQAGIRSGISAEGNVNMLQRLVQYRPVALGEVLVVRGQVEKVEPVPRGHRVSTSVTFEDRGGAVVIDASRTSLRPDPAQGASRGAGARPEPVVADPTQTETVGSHRLTPEQVKDYSMEGNSIHYDEAAAQAAGFRAPMIGGGMGVHFLAAALWSQAPPQRLDLDIYFRRPIFWDEIFTAAVLGEAAQPDRWQALCLLRDESERGLKVLTEARINALTKLSE